MNLKNIKSETLQVINGRFVNCYCNKDYVLDYVLRGADLMIKPIGV